MNCDKIKHLISRWADNELHEKFFNEVNCHIRDCRECRIYYNEEFTLAGSIKTLPAPLPSKGLKKRIIKDFFKSRKAPGFFKWWKYSEPGIKSAVVSIAAAGIILGFIFAQKTAQLKSVDHENIYVMAVTTDNGGLF